MKSIFFITGWSPVNGDVAYVEADSAPDARARLDQELTARGFECSTPTETWQAIEMSRPLVIVFYRD
jgi:hypothetical protein